jgi:hypothetical protein
MCSVQVKQLFKKLEGPYLATWVPIIVVPVGTLGMQSLKRKYILIFISEPYLKAAWIRIFHIAPIEEIPCFVQSEYYLLY